MATTIRIPVRFFASLREALGAETSVELPAGSSVAALRAALIERGGAFAEKLGAGRAVRCAVAQVMCSDENAALADGVEVAFFPPVTGG